MFQSDIVGVIIVYLYVAFILFLTEKIVSKKYTLMGRKVLHIMVGNIAFILPIFQTREMMAFVAAGPFILFTFLMSPYSPLKKIRDKLSKSGHGLGLVYYAIAWTTLAYVFFDYKEVIAIGILAMSYGDGFASIIGLKFGEHKYKILGDIKSIEGSIAMFIFTFLLIVFGLFYYNIDLNLVLFGYIILIALFSTIIEGFTPKGIDNLSVPFLTSILYWIVNYKIIIPV